MKFSGLTTFALFLTLLIAGSLFASLAFHMLDQYFCPWSGGDFCSGLEELLFHLTYFKASFISFFPLLFIFFFGLAVYLFRHVVQLEHFYNRFYSQLENLFELPQPLLRWLAIHTNSPTARV